MRTRREILIAILILPVLLSSALVSASGEEPKRIGLVMQDDYMDKQDEYALNIVSNIFVSLPKFALVEREELNSLFEEKSLKQFIGDLDGSGIHELHGLDYLGVVDHLTSQETAINGTRTQVHNITVRMLDVATGSVLGSADSKRGSLTPATTLELAGDYLKKNLMELLAKVFGIGGYVIKTAGSQIYVDMGEQHGISVGDTLEIFAEGEAVIHPVTGERLAGPAEVIATLKVQSVSPQLSVCTLKKGARPTVGDPVRYRPRNTEQKKRTMDKIKFWTRGRT